MVRFKAGLKYLFVVLLVLSLGFPLVGANAQSDQAGMPRSTDPGIRVLKSDLDGVLIEIVPPQPRLDSASEGAVSNGGLSVPGYGLSDLPGAPQLPLKMLRPASRETNWPTCRAVTGLSRRNRHR